MDFNYILQYQRSIKRIFVIISALINVGVGVAIASFVPQAAEAGFRFNQEHEQEMKRILAIVGALVTGGLAFVVSNSAQVAEAGFRMNQAVMWNEEIISNSRSIGNRRFNSNDSKHHTTG